MKAHCRIGRVKFKSGADITVLPHKPEPKTPFLKCARALDEAYTEKMTGFAVIVWDKELAFNLYYDTRMGPMTPTLLPTFLNNAFLREVIETGTIETGTIETLTEEY